MDLDITPLDVSRVLGRAAKPVKVEFVRNLEASDLVRLEVEQGIQPKPLARIRDSHHGLARALASGMSNNEASMLTGYSPSRISILKSDPAFKELLIFYQSDRRLAETQILDRVKTLTLDCIEELRDRLDNNPEEIKTRELLDIATAGLDRTGHGPSSKLQVTTLTLDADDMAKLARSAQDSNVTIIEGRSKSGGPLLGGVRLGEPLAEGETQRIEGAGTELRAGGGEEPPADDGVGQYSEGISPVREVDKVLRFPGDGARSAGSLSDLSGQGPSSGVQAETEHSSLGSASGLISPTTGIPL